MLFMVLARKGWQEKAGRFLWVRLSCWNCFLTSEWLLKSADGMHYRSSGTVRQLQPVSWCTTQVAVRPAALEKKMFVCLKKVQVIKDDHSRSWSTLPPQELITMDFLKD
jgi:hypothetical protein